MLAPFLLALVEDIFCWTLFFGTFVLTRVWQVHVLLGTFCLTSILRAPRGFGIHSSRQSESNESGSPNPIRSFKTCLTRKRDNVFGYQRELSEISMG